MKLVRNIWDGLLSVAAAAATLAVVGIPLWSAHLAVNAGLSQSWTYVPMTALLFVGGLIFFSFLRKAVGGVAPLRERKR